MIQALRVTLRVPLQLLYVLFRRTEKRPWHRCTLRDLFLLTLAYAILFAVWSPIINEVGWPQVLAAVGLRHDEPDRAQCRSGLWQLGLAIEGQAVTPSTETKTTE